MDTTLALPVKQFDNETFYNIFTIDNKLCKINAYECGFDMVDKFESDIGIQLPFLEAIYNAIIECKTANIKTYINYFDKFL